jgi:hypothetical protein
LLTFLQGLALKCILLNLHLPSNLNYCHPAYVGLILLLKKWEPSSGTMAHTCNPS